MCLLNVYLVCNLATECKKDGCKKRSAYTLIIKMYRKARNKVSYAINKAKRNYYFQKISSDMNPRDLRKTLKTVLPNKNNSHNVTSEMNGNSFNKFSPHLVKMLQKAYQA